MITTTDLQRLHTAVWSFRDSMETTPCPMDALRFAVTEAAEALDAWLRLNPKYKRNHERQERIEAELADCAIMLITALGRDYQYKLNLHNLRWTYGTNTLEDVVYQVVSSLKYQGEPSDDTINNKIYIELALMCVIRKIGDDYEQEISTKMEKLHTKHAKKAIDKSMPA